MAATQIRITKNPQIQEILSFFQNQYFGLSESEIIKVVLSKMYTLEKSEPVEIGVINYENLSPSAKKLYNEVDNIPKEELYNI